MGTRTQCSTLFAQLNNFPQEKVRSPRGASLRRSSKEEAPSLERARIRADRLQSEPGFVTKHTDEVVEADTHSSSLPPDPANSQRYVGGKVTSTVNEVSRCEHMVRMLGPSSWIPSCGVYVLLFFNNEGVFLTNVYFEVGTCKRYKYK